MSSVTSALARAMGCNLQSAGASSARISSAARLRNLIRQAPPRAPANLRSGVTSPASLPLGARFCSSRGALVCAAVSAAEAAQGKAPLQPESTIAIETLQAGTSAVDLGAVETDLLAVGVYEGMIEKDDSGALKNAELAALDELLGGAVSEILADDDFKAGKGSSVFLRVGQKARIFGLVGLGAEDKATAVVDWGISAWQAAGGAIASAAKANKAKTAAIAVLGESALPDAAVQKLSLGLLLGAYESTRFKNKPKPSPLEAVQILGSSASVEEAKAMAAGTMLTRYLVEAPPNVATPTHLAEAAALIASTFPEVMKLEVLEKEDCEKLGMGCFLGVAEASAEPPKFIHLTYTPPSGEVKRKLGVVGKGLTFDSGGYNIKAGPGSMIEMMKFDMGGSGATLGAAMATAGLKPEGVEVHFIVASCENMVDAKGLRPGDILTASNGKTVEVNNTDAEGRLTLADALLFAQNNCEVEAVVDIATLTGACMVALGPGIAGVMTPSEAMADIISGASKTAGEKVWRLPLEADYMDQLKSSVADMVNTGGRLGGTITAGLFLKEFIKEGVSWAHIDMAGPVWDDKQGGATGYGAATLTEWIRAEAEKAA